MSKIYTVGILGCANIAVRSLIPAFEENDNFNLSAVASRDFEKAEKLSNQYNCKAYGSYEELLEDTTIELVYIPLPTGLHYEWIKKALEHNKHLLVEKTLCSSLEEVEEVTKIAKKRNLLLAENFQFQFHSQQKYVLDLIDSGEIGEIRCFRASFGFPPFPDRNNIRYSKSLGGGALLDAGAYTLKALQVILPKIDFNVKAATLLTPEQSEVDLYGGIFLSSRGGGVTAQLAFGFDNFYQCSYEIWGSKGKISVPRAYTAPKDFNPTIIVEKCGEREEISLPADDHFQNILSHLADCLNKSDFTKEYDKNIQQAQFIQQAKTLSDGK